MHLLALTSADSPDAYYPFLGEPAADQLRPRDPGKVPLGDPGEVPLGDPDEFSAFLGDHTELTTLSRLRTNYDLALMVATPYGNEYEPRND